MQDRMHAGRSLELLKCSEYKYSSLTALSQFYPYIVRAL